MKRLDGRDEVILEPEIPIVDAHHHLFDKPSLRYMLDDYLEDARAGHNVIASVYVEASAFHRSTGPEMMRPLGEIEFANGVAAMSESGTYGKIKVGAGIVGYVDLRHGDALGSFFEQAMELAPDRLRGFRQIIMDHPSDAPYRFFFTGRPPQGLYTHPEFRAGFAQLAKRGLSYDATGFHLQLTDIGALADAFPETSIIVNHMTVAMGLEYTADQRRQLFEDWKNNLRSVAQRPNVSCKIGGMGMPVWGFDFHERSDAVGYEELARAWRPFVETAIDAFGVGRCMMESNYPPDARSAGYVPIFNALKHIVKAASKHEKAALFHGTAANVYRLDLSGLL